MAEVMVRFSLEKVTGSAGEKVDALIKHTLEDKPGAEETREEWTTVSDLDRLFDACSARWPAGWDLEKLLTCIRECEFD